MAVFKRLYGNQNKRQFQNEFDGFEMNHYPCICKCFFNTKIHHFYDHRSQLNGFSNKRRQTTKVVLYYVILSACHSTNYRHLLTLSFLFICLGTIFFRQISTEWHHKGTGFPIISMFTFSHSIIIIIQ